MTQKLSIDEILNWFRAGEKKPEKWLIGTEHEKFLFTNNFERLHYNGTNGIKSILQEIEKNKDWKSISENKNIIGLKHRSGASISLEPGGQLELSGAPLLNLHQTCKEAGKHLILMRDLSNKFNFFLLGIGYDPVSKRQNINWIPKSRYKIMRNYMPKVGKQGVDMMIRTCTIQVNLDYSCEEDMVKKFQTSLALQSIVTALFANSPFKEKKYSGYLSQRANVWTDTDYFRTGIPSNVFHDNFGYKSWIDYLLSVPMYFIHRNGKYIDVSGESFSNFMQGKLAKVEGYPTIQDWEDHTTVAFPEVRLKQYLEMRGADGGPWNKICALPALWVGLLYDQESLSDAFKLAKNFMKYSILEDSRVAAAKYGLNGRIGNAVIKEVARDMLNISYNGLKRRGFFDEKGISETQYLDPLFQIIENNKTPAEELLDKFYNKWKQDVTNLKEL